MEPQNLNFGGGLSHTVFNPVVAIVLIIVGLLICFAPRNRAIAAFLAGAILIPMDQVLVVGSLHFPALRILILFGLLRILWAKATSGSEILSNGMNGIDKAVILLALSTAVTGILLWQATAQVIFQLGNIYAVLGGYFVLRFLIRDEHDVQQTLRVFAYIMVVVAGFMAYERLTDKNLIYGLLGGARAVVLGTSVTRDDRVRAMGPFGHPILAGTFGAIMLPLFVGLWFKDKKNRKLAVMGMIAATVASIAANSSTALMGFAAGLFALCLWPLRNMMRPIRWGIVLTLISLHLVMKAPVWHLIARIDLSGGSDSYHRFQLVNQCILHFNDWWLVGTKTYMNWGWDMWDLANQYVGVADTSGLIPLVAFLASIVLGFKYLGKARRASEEDGDRQQELFFWALGAALFANVVSFFGISYWDQTIVAWYGLLASIPVATLASRATQLVPQANIEMERPGLALRPHLAPGSARGRLSN